MAKNLKKITTFDGVFDLFPSVSEMARQMERPTSTVQSWKDRRVFSAAAYLDLIAVCRKFGGNLTLEALHKMARK